ncbi:MAG: hypothetical protein KatS3mg002_0962 [Candidatus Woesearchaeota archaeon]|nr:MAG: hypothetical protein KatS3mg002_0962 [Candidatus Woesearchaeota archaeon]
MNSFFRKKEFWKAYALTILELVVFLLISLAAYILILINMDSVYPFIQILYNINSYSELPSDIVNQFFDNTYLFNQFILFLITIVISYSIIISFILLLFDYLIMNLLLEKTFKIKEWLLHWYKYSSLTLLLLMIVSVLFYAINNILLLAFLLIIVFITYCYFIFLIHFGKNFVHLIKKTILRLFVLILCYIFLFVALLMIIYYTNNWIGFLISFLSLAFLLLWSKIYLIKKI